MEYDVLKRQRDRKTQLVLKPGETYFDAGMVVVTDNYNISIELANQLLAPKHIS